VTTESTAAGAAARSTAARITGWLRASRAGLFVIAVLVGVGSGLGAVVFRSLISFFTWLFTGHSAFGQAGYVGSAHLPGLGLACFVIFPVIGGLIYGPLIYRYAREARGHGVPEVMVAVAEHGGRIRPQVSVVKAVASALCIGTGGSVGREGPIVQIGSALASSFGQWVRMPENRMRILVACGAAGGISATFNAPITGVFFGVEIILREFSIDAMFTVMLSAMLADAVAIPFLGHQPFLHGLPPGIMLHHPRNYLLVALLAVAAGLVGLLFKNVLYKIEDLWDLAWKGRPEWARPAIGGVVLGLVLLALPQLYGVGYPVMYRAVAGNYALWFLLVLAAGKIIACSVTLGMGGSGGVFAPSLFIGLTSGMAFGETAVHIFGPAAGQPALYAVVAMGAVFTAAARAPLTSVASVVEMTGDYALTLPVMLAVAIATATSRMLSYSTIYTAKLLRRGYDLDRAAPWRAFGDLKAADAMRPFAAPLAIAAGADGTAAGGAPGRDAAPGSSAVVPPADRAGALPGPVTYLSVPQAVYERESLVQTLRQLETYGRDGLPVISGDGRRALGWITNRSVLQALARKIGSAPPSGQADPSTPLGGYQVMEVTIEPGSAADGAMLRSVGWPAGLLPVSVLRRRSLQPPDPDLVLAAGDRISLLARVADEQQPDHSGTRPREIVP
jgi:CIC family chloride channel protein